MKSTSGLCTPAPSHVAIIMDGNGRWAAARGLARVEGHRRGVAAVRRVVEAAPALGIRTLTLYAFSADNWKRPGPEVGRLMGLFLAYLRREAPRLREEGVRLSVIGRRDRLPGALPSAIAAAEALTAGGRRLELRIAIDYSSRGAILRAAAGLGADTAAERSEFERRLAEAGGGPPDVDLLVRTGGEQRLSDFLLWESAYAELYFTPRMWPEFGAADLAEAVRAFAARERRFGGLPASAPAVGVGEVAR
jgi:undecaprenyl diphosphate synthase